MWGDFLRFRSFNIICMSHNNDKQVFNNGFANFNNKIIDFLINMAYTYSTSEVVLYVYRNCKNN